MSNIESWLFNNFKDLPPAIRVITYFIFLLLYVYLLLSPKFIGGKMIYTTNSGYEIPYIDQPLFYSIEDRELKALTDEEGNWRIPISNRLLKKQIISIYDVELQKYMRYEISIKDMWFRNFINLNIKDGKLNKITTLPQSISFLTNLFNKKFLYAQSLNLPDIILNTTEISLSENSVVDKIMDIILQTIDMNSTEIDTKSNIFDNNNFSVIEQMIIYKRIKEEFNLSIPYEQWKSLKNISEIDKYITNRLVLNKYLNNNDITITPSFRNQIEELPLDIKAQFNQ